MFQQDAPAMQAFQAKCRRLQTAHSTQVRAQQWLARRIHMETLSQAGARATRAILVQCLPARTAPTTSTHAPRIVWRELGHRGQHVRFRAEQARRPKRDPCRSQRVEELHVAHPQSLRHATHSAARWTASRGLGPPGARALQLVGGALRLGAEL
jgi:hypothetical protein